MKLKRTQSRDVKLRVCNERAVLQTKQDNSLAEWLAFVDELKMTSKADPSYAGKVNEAKLAKAKFKAAEDPYKQHCILHHCL